MERLSYIDEHAREVDANRDRAWKAVCRVAGTDPANPSGAMTGFAVESAEEPSRLALHGRHWFSRYQLIFELDEHGPGRTTVRAITRAEFPGPHGKVYRALVIGTGGHVLVVRWMLRKIAAAA